MDSSIKIKMYKDMVRLRKFEENVRDLFAKGSLPGFVHLYLGEEAIAVGASAAINHDDYMTSTHRGHGHVLAKGADSGKMMAELYGKATGYNKAKGGSMHLASPEHGILGANGIVGGGIPIATGAALSARYQNNGRVAICFFGDAGSNQGTFHESINIAAAFNLPCIYICENNMYGGGVKQYYDGVFVSEGRCYVRKVKDIASRAIGYDIPGIIVDGNDVEAVYNAVKEAADRARREEGPTLIECKTYRWRTHFEGEPDTYRTKEEVAEWRAKEPVKRYEEILLNEGVLTKKDIEKIDADVNEEMKKAIEYAESSPMPEIHTALEDVFAD